MDVRNATMSPVKLPDGQSPPDNNGGGKSGLHRATCRLTAGGAERFYGKCHRKYTASCRKVWGKGEMVR